MSYNLPLWTSVYTTALSGSPSAKSSSQDAWGNIKIPAMEAVQGYNTSITDQWLPIRQSKDLTYSSLSGLPISPQVVVINASYKLDTSYMLLACGDINDVHIALNPDPNNITYYEATYPIPPNWLHKANTYGFQISTDTAMDKDIHKARPRPVYFQSRTKSISMYGDLVQTKCNLSTSYVELNVSCAGKICSAVAIRPSQLAHGPATSSVLDRDPVVADEFFGGFVTATAVDSDQSSSATERYIVKPDNPYDPNLLSDHVDFSTVSSSVYSTRYAQLLNTYYHSQTAPYAITGAVLPSLDSDDSYNFERYSYKNTTGEIYSAQEIFICHQGWLSILLIASVVMMFCGLASAILCILRRGPDILDNVSSFTWDNEFMARTVPAGGSNIDGMSRARYLKDVQVKLGDVVMKQAVGHIAVGAVDTQEIGTLRHGD